jgi:hypothetical protein
MSNENPCEIDAITGEVRTPTPSRYRAKLDTLSDVRREMAKCYRESRGKIMQPTDLGKYVYALGAIAKVIETSDLERRIELLEGGHGK